MYPANSIRAIYSFKFVVFLLFWNLLTGCQSGESGKATPETGADTVGAPGGNPVVTLSQAQYDMAQIQLGQPSLKPLSTTLRLNGEIDVPSQNMVSVSVPVGGYVRRINLEPGMLVRKGQTLVVLENPDYIQLQQDYLETKAKLEYADLEYNRQQELSRENVNALKTFQQVRSNRQTLQAQLAGLGQRLAILGIDPSALAPERLTRTISVPAPVSGYVTEVPVNNGRFVNPADVLVQLTDLSHLHLRLNVYEKDLSAIRVGQKVRFGLGTDTGGQMTHQGTIFLIGKSFASDRTVAVLAHPDGRYPAGLTPGGYVTAQVDVQTRPLPALPEAAVVSFGGKSYCYILESRQIKPATYQFRQVEVRPGIRENGYVAVSLPPAIDPGRTPVVVAGAYSLLSQLNNSEE